MVWNGSSLLARSDFVRVEPAAAERPTVSVNVRNTASSSDLLWFISFKEEEMTTTPIQMHPATHP